MHKKTRYLARFCGNYWVRPPRLTVTPAQILKLLLIPSLPAPVFRYFSRFNASCLVSNSSIYINSHGTFLSLAAFFYFRPFRIKTHQYLFPRILSHKSAKPSFRFIFFSLGFSIPIISIPFV